MKKLFLLLILSNILCFCNSNTNSVDNVNDPTAQDGGYFYINGQKTYFDVVKNKVPIRVQSAQVSNELKGLTRVDEIDIDTTYKFLGNIIVLNRRESFTGAIETIREKYADTSSEIELGNLIKTRDSRANFILTNRVIAKFKSGISEKAIDSIAQLLNCTVLERSIVRKGRIIFQCNKNNTILNANSLFESGMVEFAHPDFISEVERRYFSPFIPDDPLFAKQWHLNNTGQSGGKVDADVNAPEAWEVTKGNSNTLIAIIDDAFDVDHEDLKANLVAQKDFTNKPADDTAKPEDPSSERHGTSVAGVALAKGNNGTGVSGSCPECGLIAIRALGGSVSDHAMAFDYAVSKGAWIISNSWGYVLNSPTTDDVVDAINNAATNGRNGLGCVILFAMTNTEEDNCVQPNPDISSLENVIAISRSTNKDELGKAGYGDCMELLAPTKGGTLGITTTDITGSGGYVLGDYYNDFGGTSSATPLTAGVAGLMLSINPNLTRQQVQKILESTAAKIDPANAKYNADGFSKTHGYGRVDAYKAVVSARDQK